MKRSFTSYDDAVQRHPYVDRLEYDSIVRDDHACRDASGALLFVFLKSVLEPRVVDDAAAALRGVPSQADQRRLLNGGSPPQSGIGGYFDYTTAPVPTKCRKTAFTHTHFKTWQGAFPLVERANEAYRRCLPSRWAKQHAAIPDAVRIRGSVFSTATVNETFRTAAHTDVGDFDAGFGVLAVLEGEYTGLMLGFPEARVCVDVRPGDLLLFNTHALHANTEPESAQCRRLSCVLYYRYKLGDPACLRVYRARKRVADMNPGILVVPTPNLVNRNRRCTYTPVACTPADMLCSFARATAPARRRFGRVAGALRRCGLLHRLVGYRERPQPSSPERARREAGYRPCAARHDKATGEANPARAKRARTVLGFAEEQLRAAEADIASKAVDMLCSDVFVATTFGAALARSFRRTQADLLASMRGCGGGGGGEEPPEWRVPPGGPARAALYAHLKVVSAMFAAKNGVSPRDARAADVRSFHLGFATHLLRRLTHGSGGGGGSARGRVALPFLARRVEQYLAAEGGDGAGEGVRDEGEGEEQGDGEEDGEEPEGTEDHEDDQEQEEEQEQDAGASAPLPQPAHPVYTPARVTPWASSVAFDYQTEDVAVDWASLGLAPPDAAPLLRKVVSVEAGDSAEVEGLASAAAAAAAAIEPLRAMVFDPARYACSGTGGVACVGDAAAAAAAQAPPPPSPPPQTSLTELYLRQYTADSCPPSRAWPGCIDDVEVATPPSEGGDDDGCAGRYDVVCLQEALSVTQESPLLLARAAAKAVRTDGGVVCVRDFSPAPFDAARLTPGALAERVGAVAALTEHRARGRCDGRRAGVGGGESAGHNNGCLLTPNEVDDVMATCGLVPMCGLFQVKGSCLNEYLSFYCKPERLSGTEPVTR